MKFSVLLLGVIISFVFICAVVPPANAQCVPDTLTVTSISGRVIAKLDRGETPLDNAVVTLKKVDNLGPVISKQTVNKDGSFSFRKIKSGKYYLIVSVPHLIDFDLKLDVRRLNASKDRKEIVVIMGADFIKECNGSSAELRTKKVI